MKIQEFIDQLRANGRYWFTFEEAKNTLKLTQMAALNTLLRLKRSKQIVSPAKGFYLIVTPEYQAFGCLPAEMFIDDLMNYFQHPYYIGYLTAAQFYGAAHQKPQQFQVITLKNRRPISCGRIHITFTANKDLLQMPTKRINTSTGTMTIAMPEVIAKDLVSYPERGAGISNVATVLMELSENIDIERLTKLTTIFPEPTWMQRLGYLWELLECNELANRLGEVLSDKKLHWIKLVAKSSYQNLARNKRWKIIVNTEVEPDL